MNYLAHAYLSFQHPEILVGNMISDFVKGRKKFDYNSDIQEGIRLHRSIDMYTDAHEATAEAKKVFKPSVGLYSGAFVDVAYDHFLANDADEFQQNELKSFAAKTYQVLFDFHNLLPERFASMLPYMRSQDWLFNYSKKEGIRNSFQGLAYRAKYLESSSDAYLAFEKHYEVLKACYNIFFPAVKIFAFNQYQQFQNR